MVDRSEDSKQGRGTGEDDLPLHGVDQNIRFLFNGKLKRSFDRDEQQDKVKGSGTGQLLVLFAGEEGDLALDRVKMQLDVLLSVAIISGVMGFDKGLERDFGIDDDRPVFREDRQERQVERLLLHGF